jgi:hypothetical protein
MDLPLTRPVFIQLNRQRKEDPDLRAPKGAFDPAILVFERLKSVKLPLGSAFVDLSLTLYLVTSNLCQLTHTLVPQQVSAAVTLWNCVRLCFSVNNFRLIYDIQLVHLLVCST